jgi:glycine/D-amino acid oxidase-like deaminating enzyme
MTSVTTAVCGAGIAGVSTAYFLSVVNGVDNVVIVDPRPPLTLTSDKSTECYRNWWPNPTMVGFMDRSIDLLEDLSEASGNAFHLNRRGYVYCYADTPPDAAGAELIGRGDLRRRYPYLSADARSAVRVRRAGWFSAHQLGAWMLERAREHGASFVRDRVTGVEAPDGRVVGVHLGSGAVLSAERFVNAAGPMLGAVSGLTGADVPVQCELHLKVAFRDPEGAVPRDAPLLIWAAAQRLALTEEERDLCIAGGREDLLEELPAGCHCRPEGGEGSDWVLGLWEYQRRVMEPIWPLPIDPLYAQTVLRGLATMIPGLGVYESRPAESVVDGGYYTKAADNLPLIGPCGADGAFVCGALSGYGVMAACAAGELAALHVVGGDLPGYAAAFSPQRFDDPVYVAGITATDSGQL